MALCNPQRTSAYFLLSGYFKRLKGSASGEWLIHFGFLLGWGERGR